MGFLDGAGAKAVAELLKPENVAQLKAAAFDVLETLLRSNVIEIQARYDAQTGIQASIAFTPKSGEQQ